MATGNATAEVFSAWNGDTATATIHGLYNYVRRIAEHRIFFFSLSLVSLSLSLSLGIQCMEI